MSTSEIGRISSNARWSHINCLGRRVHASSPTMSRVCHLLHLSAWKMRNPLVILLEVSGLVSIDECDYEHQSKLEVAVGCSWWSLSISRRRMRRLASCMHAAWRQTGDGQTTVPEKIAQILCPVRWSRGASGLKLQSGHLLHLASFSLDLRSSIAGEDTLDKKEGTARYICRLDSLQATFFRDRNSFSLPPDLHVAITYIHTYIQ